MGAPIFPNSSYFVAYGTDHTFMRELSQLSINFNCRIYSCNRPEDIKEILSVIEKPVAFIICPTGITTEDWSLLIANIKSDSDVPVLCYTYENDVNVTTTENMILARLTTPADENQWQEPFVKLLESLNPAGLGRVTVEAFNSVFPKFGLGLNSFSLTKTFSNKATHQLNFQITGGEFIGNCVTRFSIESLKTNTLTDEFKIVDTVKEAINQSVGLVIQAISRSGLGLKIGLPTLFNLEKIPLVQTTKYFPSVTITDVDGKLSTSLGFINLGNEKMFDLSEQGAAQSGDIEFL